MFERRRDATTRTEGAGRPPRPAAELPAGDSAADSHSAHQPPAREGTTQAQGALTLNTMCRCGHTRRDHRGLRIEATGPCLECHCAEFARTADAPESREQMFEKIRAGLDRLEGLQEIVEGLSAQVNHELLDRAELLALQRDFCGEELVRSSGVEVGDSGHVASLRIRHTQHATVVSLERVQLYVRAHQAMLVAAVGGLQAERWRVLWKGALDSPAHPEREPGDVSESGGGAER